MHKKLIVAHAGGRSQAPPNTLDAFAHAIALGADMIEFDVRQTSDRELVVHHDDAIGNRLLARMEFAECARCAAAAGYRLPRLGEVLDLAIGRVKLDIELKETGFEEAVLGSLIDRRFRPLDFVITSFEQPAVTRVKVASADVRVGLLVYDVTGLEALDRFRKSGADFLAPDYQLLDEATCRQAASLHVQLLPWTVNDPAVTRNLLREPAVIGVITDATATALEIRDAMAGG